MYALASVCVGGATRRFISSGGDAPAAPPANAAQAGQAHQPLDALEVDDVTHIHKLGADTMSAVCVVTRLVDQANTLSHDLIVTGALAGREATPVIVGTAGDLQMFAHGLYGLDGLICLNQRVDVLSTALSLLANQAVAFASMSRSWVIWRT